MKLADAGTFFGSHLVAGLVYGVLFGILPLAMALASMIVLIVLGIIFNDLGGPLWLPMYLVACVLYALVVLAAGVGLFGVTALLRAIGKRTGLAWWIPLLAVPGLGLVAFTMSNAAHPAILTAAVSLPFAVYWISLVSAESIAVWIRRRIAARRSARSV